MQCRDDGSRRAVNWKRRLPEGLDMAIDRGFKICIDGITPRSYVALMTTSSSELGRAIKDAIDGEEKSTDGMQ